MIGRSLSERHGVPSMLSASEATTALTAALPTHGQHLVEVRAQDMIAVVVLDAHAGSQKLLEDIGLSLETGRSAVFGLAGVDAAKTFASLNQRAWFEAPLGPRETRVVLVTTGLALVSIEVASGKTTMRVLPDHRSN